MSSLAVAGLPSMTEADCRGSTTPVVVLFDGVCNLCDQSVQFVIRNDPNAVFLFSPLQSEYARRLIEQMEIDGRQFDPEALNTFIVVVGGMAYYKSDAWMVIFDRLKWPIRGFAVFRFVPRRIRDAIYTFVGDRRYRWFGKKPSCMVPSPDVRQRFLIELEPLEGGG